MVAHWRRRCRSRNCRRYCRGWWQCDALYDNNVTVLNIKQNEAMRILAIMAFVTFPLVLFASLFGMNAVSTPIIGHKYDFWIIIGVMLAATIGMFAFFKRKKWL